MRATRSTTSSLSHVSIVKVLGVSVLLSLLFASNIRAEGPKEQLQETIDGIIKILKTIRTPAEIGKNRNAIRQLLLTRFDFAAMAQRSLGNRWGDLRGHQQEFVAVFTDFVEQGYMNTVGSYRGEKVVYDQVRIKGESAEVGTRIIGGEGAPIKIDYRLHLTHGAWMVYDAVIDDVSVVDNYRSQFARVLRTASLDELTQSLRAKSSER